MTHGRLYARFAFVNGQTRLIEHRQQAPLKIARAFATADGGLEVCVMDASPGLLSGDFFEQEWHIEKGARVRVTTQGATRVHPSDGSISRQQVQVHVGENAHFEWWPETTIPFAGARFASSIHAHMEESATLLLLEGLSAGRIARGEVFAFQGVQSRVHVQDAHGPLFYACNRFEPQGLNPRHLLAWADALQWNNWLGFGPGAAQLPLLAVEEILERYGLSGGASQLSRGGIGVSFLGRRAADTRLAALDLRRVISTFSSSPLIFTS